MYFGCFDLLCYEKGKIKCQCFGRLDYYFYYENGIAYELIVLQVRTYDNLRQFGINSNGKFKKFEGKKHFSSQR